MDFRYTVHDRWHGEFHLDHCGALLDVEHGIVVVDTSSRKTGENVVSEIRRALAASRRCR